MIFPKSISGIDRPDPFIIPSPRVATHVGKLKANEYNGRVSAQFTLEDIAI